MSGPMAVPPVHACLLHHSFTNLSVTQCHQWNILNLKLSRGTFFLDYIIVNSIFQLYNDFIDASKIEENNKRLNAIRRKIRILPEENFETLRHLCQHLVQVIEHCETNKMEVRNLAIVFGPTLVRPADDNMLSMVTDMSHQCRIIGMYIITENRL